MFLAARATAVVVLALVLLAPASLRAACGPECDACWVNTEGGDWDQGSNWLAGTPPLATDYVCVDAPAPVGGYTVTATSAVTVGGLLVDGGLLGVATLTLGPMPFTLDGEGTIGPKGELKLYSTLLTTNQDGTLTVDGTADLSGGTIDVPLTLAGTLVWTNMATLSEAPITQPGCLMTTGDNAAGSAQLQIMDDTFVNCCEVRFTSVESRSLTVDGTLVNQVGGVIRTFGTGRRAGVDGPMATVDARVENYGLVEAETLPLAIASTGAGDHLNHPGGTISSGGAELVLDLSGTKAPGSFTNQGNVRIGILKAPRTVVVRGGTFYPSTGTVTGTGTLILDATTVSPLLDPVTLANGGYTLVLADVVVAQGATVANAAETLVWGTTTVLGSLTNAATGTVAVQGTADRGNAFLAFAASASNGGVLELDNADTEEWAATVVLPAGATLTNEVGGEIVALQGGGGYRGVEAELDNQGTVRAVATTLTLAAADADHLNSGEVRAEGGTIWVDLDAVKGAKAPGSFTNQGNVRIGVLKQGSVVHLQGGTFYPAEGTVTGTGDLELVGTTVAALGMPAVGTLVNDATTLFLVGCTVEAGASVVNNGSAHAWGTNAVYGELGNAAGATLAVEGTAAHGGAVLSLASGMSNAGTIELDDTDSAAAQAATLACDGGAFVNLATATLRSRSTDDGSRTLACALDNRGTVRVLSGQLNVGRSNAAHVSSGSVDLLGGDLHLDLSLKGERTSSFTNLGLVDIGLGRTLRAHGGSFTNDTTGEIRGRGTLDAPFTPLTNAGLLAPGSSPGHLTVVGDLAQTGSARIEVEIGGNLPGDEHDWLEVDGSLELAGTLEVVQLDPFHPAVGDEFAVLSWGSHSGAFATVTEPVLDHGLAWDFTAGATQGVVHTLCVGPELAVTMTADKNPVTVDHELAFTVTVTNSRPVPATLVRVHDVLPSTLVFVPGSSSPGCNQLGGDVECIVGVVAGTASATVVIAVTPIAVGEETNSVTVELDECDLDDANNSSSLTVTVTSAEPCDADGDGDVTTEDLAAAVAHLYGQPAAGNPDCAEGDGLDAADLASTIAAATLP